MLPFLNLTTAWPMRHVYGPNDFFSVHITDGQKSFHIDSSSASFNWVKLSSKLLTILLALMFNTFPLHCILNFQPFLAAWHARRYIAPSHQILSRTRTTGESKQSQSIFNRSMSSFYSLEILTSRHLYFMALLRLSNAPTMSFKLSCENIGVFLNIITLTNVR